MNHCLLRKIVKKSRKMREKIFLVLTLALTISAGTLALGAQKEREAEAYYECVTIHSGDTLWAIAQKYKSNDQKTEQMIYEIMKINGMCSGNIRAGESLIVPIKT
ncbi:MAG: LysM peptidoglycan-binding domain-containing protein [Clostridia bacterium]|nr:LysM peptidoglycan-binding domain-containing protein [Clostridia bacterium]